MVGVRGCRTLHATSVESQHQFDLRHTDGHFLLCLCLHTHFERLGQIYHKDATPVGGAEDDFDDDNDENDDDEIK